MSRFIIPADTMVLLVVQLEKLSETQVAAAQVWALDSDHPKRNDLMRRVLSTGTEYVAMLREILGIIVNAQPGGNAKNPEKE